MDVLIRSIVIIPLHVQRSEHHIVWFKCIQFYLSITLWYNWENVISEQPTVINISFLSNMEKINSEEIDKNTIHLDLRPWFLRTVISGVMLTNHLLLMWNIQVFGEKMSFQKLCLYHTLAMNYSKNVRGDIVYNTFPANFCFSLNV